jgi:hypothetical protein
LGEKALCQASYPRFAKMEMSLTTSEATPTPTDSEWSVIYFLDEFLLVLHCYIQAVGIANGLRYLHSVNIVHGNLKAVSFLLLSALDYMTAEK